MLRWTGLLAWNDFPSRRLASDLAHAARNAQGRGQGQFQRGLGKKSAVRCKYLTGRPGSFRPQCVVLRLSDEKDVRMNAPGAPGIRASRAGSAKDIRRNRFPRFARNTQRLTKNDRQILIEPDGAVETARNQYASAV